MRYCSESFLIGFILHSVYGGRKRGGRGLESSCGASEEKDRYHPYHWRIYAIYRRSRLSGELSLIFQWRYALCAEIEEKPEKAEKLEPAHLFDIKYVLSV